MEVVAEFFGIDTDKGAWEYFRNHWRDWFPKIASRSNFAKHAANLWNIKQKIQRALLLRPAISVRSMFGKSRDFFCFFLRNVSCFPSGVIARKLGAFSDPLHMADGFPMPVCHFKRAYFSKIFRGEAAYSHCASKDEKYYGFKGNILISSEGVVTDITVAAANIDERESLWDLFKEIYGMIIADKGWIGEGFQDQLRQHAGVNMQTAVRSNM